MPRIGALSTQGTLLVDPTIALEHVRKGDDGPSIRFIEVIIFDFSDGGDGTEL